MKTTAITIVLILTFASCNEQVKQNENPEETKSKYQEISESSIRFGEHNSILDCKPTLDGNYLLYVRANSKDDIHKNEFYFLKISAKGDSVNSMPISFENFLTDYIELDEFYYAVTTDLGAIDDYRIDFLNKYDKNWKRIWSKKIDKPKNPEGTTVLTLTSNNEILLIANECIPETEKMGISVRRYDLDGKLISENLMLTRELSNPVSLNRSADDNFYLTAEQYDQTTNMNSLWLMKLSHDGDTLWTKKYPDFYPCETILTSDGNLVFYGSNYSPTEERKTRYHYLKIIVTDKNGTLKWQKDIKQNYYESPGNLLETKEGNYLFSSTITPIKDKGDRAYLFELNQNGDLTFERKFEYPVGIGSVPYIFIQDVQITMIGQKWIGKFGEPFKDVIQIIKLNSDL